MMKRIWSYFAIGVFTGITILFVGSYSAWLFPEFQSTTKKEEIDLQNITDRQQTNLQEILSINTTSPNYDMNSANQAKLHMIIVPYFDTTSPDWQVLYGEADKNPGVIRYVIINPCSGPCEESLSPQWQQVIMELKKREIKTLGYVFDTDQSIKNIDHYMKAHTPTDGIFFDNEGSSDTLDRFKQYAEYVRGLGGIVYINPGFNYPHLDRYTNSNLVDVINIYEFESSKSHHMEINRIDPTRISAILGDVYDVSEMEEMINKTAEEGIGVVYVYSNSYYRLPAFFSEMVEKVSTTEIKQIDTP